MPIEIEDSLEEQLGVRPLQEFVMYGGKIKLLYDDDAHKYYIEGAEGRFSVPNATTVLETLDKSNALIPWAVRCAIQSLETRFNVGEGGLDDSSSLGLSVGAFREALETARKAHRVKKDEAADIGKMAHKWLERYSLLRRDGRTPDQIFAIHPIPQEPRALSCVYAALAWFQEHHVVFVEAERKVYSIEDNSCGTFDLIAIVDGKRSLLDYKSSNGLYDTHRFQLAFYQSAYEEETGLKIEQRILLRLGKENGEFEPHFLVGEEQYRADLLAYKGLLITYERVQELKEEKAAAKAVASAAKKAAKKLKAA